MTTSGCFGDAFRGARRGCCVVFHSDEVLVHDFEAVTSARARTSWSRRCDDGVIDWIKLCLFMKGNKAGGSFRRRIEIMGNMSGEN